MNASYYNGEPGSRSIDFDVEAMHYECENFRGEGLDELADALEEYADELEAECGDDIDDEYDREREYEEDFD